MWRRRREEEVVEERKRKMRWRRMITTFHPWLEGVGKDTNTKLAKLSKATINRITR